MTTKYLDIYPKWDCKKAGGLLLGIRLHFPSLIFVHFCYWLQGYFEIAALADSSTA